MSRTTVLVDLVQEAQADEENGGEEVSQIYNQLYMVAARVLTYFEEMDNWSPVVCPCYWSGPMGGWVVKVKNLKQVIVSEFSQYYNSTIQVHKAFGQTKNGGELDDSTDVSIVQWFYVCKAPASSGTPAVAAPPRGVAAVHHIECQVFLHDQHQWKPIKMPDRSTPTNGRLFTSIRMLKSEALKAFGYNVESFVNTVRFQDINVYYNDSGKASGDALANNTKVVNGKWYSMTVSVSPWDELERAPTTPEGDSWESWSEVQSQLVCEEDVQ